MKITDEMLTAAISKAVEAGLLPRRPLREDMCEARLLMREILGAALESAKPAAADIKPSYRRISARDAFPAALPTRRREHGHAAKRQGRG